MKAFVAVLALVVAVVAEESVQQPTVYLQPPVEHYQNKEFNTQWTVENSWVPVADPHQPVQVVQQSYAPVNQQNYAPVNHGNYNPEDCQQNYQQVNQEHYHNEEQHHQQASYQSNDSPSAVEVKVTHPDWATSYSNVNRYNKFWSAQVQFVPTAPVLATPAPFTKHNYAPTSAPVPVYNHNVAKWNTWNNQPEYDVTKVPQSVAKYVAITPGSVHIAPLPGHTVSHKVLNVASAGSW